MENDDEYALTSEDIQNLKDDKAYAEWKDQYLTRYLDSIHVSEQLLLSFETPDVE